LKHEWITAENINTLIESNGVVGDIDLLSIDIDGMDYWIWKAIEIISPRVVVIEVNLMWGTERAVTAPYDPNFVTQYSNGKPLPNSGASLPALVKLADAKGYRLIGCQRYGFNAFFLRKDIGADLFRTMSVEKSFDHPHANLARKHFRPQADQYDWVEV